MIREKGEDAIIAILIEAKVSLDGALGLIGGRCLLIKDEKDLVDALESKIAAPSEQNLTLRDQLKYFSWHHSGLSPSIIDQLVSNYNNLPDLVQSIKNGNVPARIDLNEVIAILAQDYYIE